jgi:hypothetical protein
MIIAIYSNNFDVNENVVNNGMSGKIFLDKNYDGSEDNLNLDRFCGEYNNIHEVMEVANANNITLSAIIYEYYDAKTKNQYYKKFNFCE